MLCAACSNALRAGAIPSKCIGCGDALHAEAPPEWEEPIARMKEHPEIKSPNALAWWMHERGQSPDSVGEGKPSFRDEWGAFSAAMTSAEPTHAPAMQEEGDHTEPDGDESPSQLANALHARGGSVRLPGKHSRLRRLTIPPAVATPSTLQAQAEGVVAVRALTLFAENNAFPFMAESSEPHPNLVPFKATLHPVDRPSDKPPNGSHGHLVMIPRAVAAARLQDLIGMPINVQAGAMTGHQTRQPIGVITHAGIGKDPAPDLKVPGFRPDANSVIVAGHLWAKNFPNEVYQLRAAARAGLMGTSYEVSDVELQDPAAQVWTVRGMRYTGAAALTRQSAAYTNTQLAASHDVNAGASVTVKFDNEQQQGGQSAMTIPSPGGIAAGPPNPAMAPPLQPGAVAPPTPTAVAAQPQPGMQPQPAQPFAGAPAPGGAPPPGMAPAPPGGAPPAPGGDVVTQVAQAVMAMLGPRLEAIESTVSQLAMKPGDAPEEQELNEQANDEDRKAKEFRDDGNEANQEAAGIAAELATMDERDPKRALAEEQLTAAQDEVTECMAAAQTHRARALILRAQAQGFGPLLQAMAALISDESVQNRKLLTDMGTKVSKSVEGLITDKKGGAGAPGQGGMVGKQSGEKKSPDGSTTGSVPEGKDVKAGSMVPPPPKRVSLSAEAMRTVGKFDLEAAGTGTDGVYDEAKLDEAFSAARVSSRQRMTVKNELMAQGRLRGRKSKHSDGDSFIGRPRQ